MNAAHNFRPHFYARYVAQAYQRTILRRFQNDIAKLFFRVQTPLSVNGDQEIALWQRLGTELSGGNLYVLLLHRRYDIRSR